MSIATDEKTELEKYQARVAKDRTRFNTIVSWHLQLWSSEGIELPYNVDATYVSVEYKDPVYEDYKKPVPVTDDNAKGWEYCWDTTLDEQKIIDHLSKVVKFARSQGFAIEKDYSSSFSIEVTIPKNERDESSTDTTIRYYCDRDAVCTKRVVGTKVVPAHTTPERIEEVVEYDCQKIAFTK